MWEAWRLQRGNLQQQHFSFLWGEERKQGGGEDERRRWPGSTSQAFMGRLQRAQPPAAWHRVPEGPWPLPAKRHPAILLSLFLSPHTHVMLVLHFSQVWSLGGVARALDVGREDWGLSKLGTMAGVPPGRVGDRHTQAQPSSAAVRP